jgi:DnaD/phage-associated family protein
MRGFPPSTHYTPVPDPLLGPLLEQIDDLAELKCVLRLLWMLAQKEGTVRIVTENELLTDAALNRGVASMGNAQAVIREGLHKAVERGVLLRLDMETDGVRRAVYALNDEQGYDAIIRAKEGSTVLPPPWGEREAPPPEQPNIFALYEDNIGLLTPILAERLKDAAEQYPESWIADAIKEAVAHNARHWRYIEAILERWAREGRGEHGKPGRYPEKISFEEYRRRFGGPPGD